MTAAQLDAIADAGELTTPDDVDQVEDVVDPARPTGHNLAWFERADPPTWPADVVASCVADPEAWFPPSGHPTEEVVAVCAGCPMRTECLDDALATGPGYGVWAGYSAAAIRRMRAERGITEEPVVTRPGCTHGAEDLYESFGGRVRCRGCARDYERRRPGRAPRAQRDRRGERRAS